MLISLRPLFLNVTLQACLLFSVSLAADLPSSAEPVATTSVSKNLPLVELETTQGIIILQLLPSAAPKACENFLTHVKNGYYNELSFHRIIPGFMVQGGDPNGTGTGGQSIWGKPFEDEFIDGLNFDKPGVVAMANAGPGTNGSQFFITLAKTPWLNKKHTIFATVIQGYENVERLGAQGSQSGATKQPQKIIRARVLSLPAEPLEQSVAPVAN